MKILIIADDESYGKIELSMKGLGAFLSGGPVEVSRERESSRSWDIIIASGDALSSLGDSEQRALNDGETRLFVYYRGMFIDPRNEEQFGALEEVLLRTENWNVLKEVNELKIKLGYLFRKTTLGSYPTFMQLELTDKCNAECIMCSHLYQKNIGAEVLGKEGLEAVRKILPYVRVAILHGNGEPFLHPMLPDILEEYCRYNICVSTSTNLSVFSEKLAGYVNRCFADIRVSCDGCTKEIYEQIRRNLSFDRLTENLEMLKNLCPDVKKLLMVVIMRQNIHQLEEFVPFAKKYGFSEVVFSNMMPSIALGNESDSPLHYEEAVKYRLMRAAELGKELGVSVVYPDCYDRIEGQDIYVEPVFRSDEEIECQRKLISDTYHLDRVPLERMQDCDWEVDRVRCSGICDWCMERTYIDLHGNVFVCCINNRYSLGNIVETDFESVWNCSEMQRIRQSFFDGKLPDFCEGCHFILNQSLPHIMSVDKSQAFFDRRCISRVYRESGSPAMEGDGEDER